MIALFTFCLFGCTTSRTSSSAASETSGQRDELGEAGEDCREVCVAGTVNIIWNGEPRYSLFDDEGRQRPLLIAEETAREAGGPLRLNGKRVIVVGDCADDPPGSIRVRSIQLEEDGQTCKQQSPHSIND